MWEQWPGSRSGRVDTLMDLETEPASYHQEESLSTPSSHPIPQSCQAVLPRFSSSWYHYHQHQSNTQCDNQSLQHRQQPGIKNWSKSKFITNYNELYLGSDDDAVPTLHVLEHEDSEVKVVDQGVDVLSPGVWWSQGSVGRISTSITVDQLHLALRCVQWFSVVNSEIEKLLENWYQLSSFAFTFEWSHPSAWSSSSHLQTSRCSSAEHSLPAQSDFRSGHVLRTAEFRPTVWTIQSLTWTRDHLRWI